jgi:hypothetical protein
LLLRADPQHNQILVVVLQLVDWVVGLLLLPRQLLVVEIVAISFAVCHELLDSSIAIVLIYFAHNLELESVDGSQTTEDLEKI